MTANAPNKPRVLSTRVVQLQDTDPDLSWLGSYADRYPKNVDPLLIFDRQLERVWERGTYRYFVATEAALSTATRETTRIRETRRWARADFEHMESYNHDGWSCIGIRAEATVLINGTLQTITSAGLWGIESDSDPDYFAEVGAEEMAELTTTLAELGLFIDDQTEQETDR